MKCNLGAKHGLFLPKLTAYQEINRNGIEKEWWLSLLWDPLLKSAWLCYFREQFNLCLHCIICWYAVWGQSARWEGRGAQCTLQRSLRCWPSCWVSVLKQFRCLHHLVQNILLGSHLNRSQEHDCFGIYVLLLFLLMELWDGLQSIKSEAI